MSAIATGIDAVQAQISSACSRVGRADKDVMLVAVSKRKSIANIVEAKTHGIRHFGENRVDEALEKAQDLHEGVHWHFVGHIQSRKAKDIVRLQPYLVHSVDNLKLAERLNKYAEAANITLDILLEMNISGEASKSGWPAAQWKNNQEQRKNLWQEIEILLSLSHINVMGLMTMAPFYDDAEQTRPVFRALATLRETLQASLRIELQHLSMGMTNDFEVAIEEGATIVRVGRAIFGERD